MSTDAVADRFTCNAQRTAGGVALFSDLTPAARGRFPFQSSQRLFATRPHQARLHPIGPVAAIAVAGVVDDEVQRACSFERHVDVNRVTRRVGRDRRADEPRPRGGRLMR